MEYLEGETLAQRLTKGPLPTGQALQTAVEIADALDAAHHRGVVHRDLKPGNIMLTKAGAKLLDFGIAARLAGADLETATRSAVAVWQTGDIAGTLPYMAPKVLRGEAPDAGSDIWALGVVLYETVAGQVPFTGESVLALTSAIQLDEPSRLPERVPPSLRQIVQRCLAKDATRRYQQASEVRAVLEAVGPTSWAQASSAATQPARRHSGVPRPVVPLAAAALLVVLIVLGLMARWARVPVTDSGTIPQVDSIAVLPLANLMGDAEQDYFVDGMHDALIAELAQIEALTVISRTSVQRYRDTELSISEIAAELNVDAIVEGSVLRADNQVRITAQLVGVSPERHLWVEVYDGEVRDILSLQSQVATAVAREIRVTVTPEEQARLGRTRPVDPVVYTQYLRGRHLCDSAAVEQIRRGTDTLSEAIAGDPTYAPAHAELAKCLSTLSLLSYLPPAEWFPLAEAAATRALELDETLAEAHASLGYMRFLFKLDWSGPQRHFDRALELESNNVNALMFWGVYLTFTGRHDEAREAYDRAMELDPLSYTTAQYRAWGSFMARRYDDSIRQLENILELDPQAFHAREWLAINYVKTGMLDEGLAEARKIEARVLESEEQHYLGGLGWMYGMTGQRDDTLRVLSHLQGLGSSRWLDPTFNAWIYMGLGDSDNAFHWLREAYKQRATGLVFLPEHPMVDPIRSDPRMKQLLSDMGIEK